MLPPDDDSISKYICPKYIKKINTQDRSSKSTAKTFVTTRGVEKSTKQSNDLKLGGEEVSAKKSVKFDEK